MNRLFTLILIGLAGLLASCGSSVTSSTQPATNDVYSVAVSPDRFTLNAGDWSFITATVDVSNQNNTPKAVSPQPTIKFNSSDPRVTVSPSGEVCAGQWDTRFLTCAPTTAPATGQLDLPTGQVTITAYNASHNVSGTTFVTVHPRATSIKLSATVGIDPVLLQYPSTGCVSQNNQVRYSAAAVNAGGTIPGTDANGKAIPGTEIFDNDYTWVVGDANVAAVSSFGVVIARNPGVTNVYAKLNGTVSAPLAFATCPPSAIVLGSSVFTNGKLPPPGTLGATVDLTVNNGDQEYLTATPVDANGKTLLDANSNTPLTLPVNFITTNPLMGTISPIVSSTSKLTLNTSGRFTVTAACEPPTCNPSVLDFVSPAGRTTGKAVGFGFPIYSNVIGVRVQGTTGSTVLVTGTNFTDVGATPAHLLLAYDSEALTITHTVALANVPNSLVIAPNGARAYLGSSDGLMVVDLTSYQSSSQGSFPIAGGISTDLITGTVLGVSQDSRYVLISDVANGFIFFIDTTGTKVAVRYPIAGIRAVTFAADGSNIWIAGDSGVYVFNSDAFVKTSTSNITGVKALAWMPDGQSYFASGNQLVNSSTCDDQNPQTPLPNLPTTVPGGLETTATSGVPHVVGLAGKQWFDYSVSTTAQIGQVVAPAPPVNTGFVCLSKVVVNAPATAASTLQCTAQQISFSPALEQAFVTGVDPACAIPEPFIHGYTVSAPNVSAPEFTLKSASPIIPLSGGVLNDGRKLYVGTFDSTAKTAALHRFDLSTGTDTAGTLAEDASVSVELVPSFVAVIPK